MKFIHKIIQKHPSFSNLTNSIKLFRMQDILKQEVFDALQILILLPSDHEKVGFDNTYVGKNEYQSATKNLKL